MVNELKRASQNRSGCYNFLGLIVSIVLFLMFFVSVSEAAYSHYLYLRFGSPLSARTCYRLPTPSCGGYYGQGLYQLLHVFETYIEVRYRNPPPSGPWVTLRTFEIAEVEEHENYGSPIRADYGFFVPYMKNYYQCPLETNSCVLHAACMPCCCAETGSTDYNSCLRDSYPFAVMYECWNHAYIEGVYPDLDCDGWSVVEGDCYEDSYNNHYRACNSHPGGVEVCGNGWDEDCSGADLLCFQSDWGTNNQDFIKNKSGLFRKTGKKFHSWGGYEEKNK